MAYREIAATHEKHGPYTMVVNGLDTLIIRSDAFVMNGVTYRVSLHLSRFGAAVEPSKDARLFIDRTPWRKGKEPTYEQNQRAQAILLKIAGEWLMANAKEYKAAAQEIGLANVEAEIERAQEQIKTHERQIEVLRAEIAEKRAEIDRLTNR